MIIQVAAQTPNMVYMVKMATQTPIHVQLQLHLIIYQQTREIWVMAQIIAVTTTTSTIPVPVQIAPMGTGSETFQTPLTEAQEHLVAHGPNFVLVPREPPTCEYIAATEKVCQQLMQGKVKELRGEIKSLLKKNHRSQPNIPKDEYQVLREIKRDNTRMVLIADKGVSMVVVDREDYTAKSEELLHQPNYKVLQTDPTNKYKNKLISLLKPIKTEGGMDDNTYRRLYPTEAVPPKYYGLPKVHKPGMPIKDQ